MKKLTLKHCILFSIFALGLQINTFAQSGETNIEQSDLLPKLLDLKTEMTKDGKLGERYKIQLYYGDNNTASETLKDFRAKYDTWPSQVIYETPNYKVWIGNFRNRLEADRALMKIKADYPAAFIPKPRRG